MITCTKKYSDIPFAHRQPGHDGHCKFIHGHNWSFEFTFTCKVFDDNGFVVDFGKLSFIKEFLSQFDHAVLVLRNDEFADAFDGMQQQNAAKVLWVEDASCEGLAKFVFDTVQSQICQIDALLTRGVTLVSVTVFEDSKNSATYSK